MCGRSSYCLATVAWPLRRLNDHNWAHHRGQMTVYLRLMGAKVPALYAPSADDRRSIDQFL